MRSRSSHFSSTFFCSLKHSLIFLSVCYPGKTKAHLWEHPDILTTSLNNSSKLLWALCAETIARGQCPSAPLCHCENHSSLLCSLLEDVLEMSKRLSLYILVQNHEVLRVLKDISQNKVLWLLRRLWLFNNCHICCYFGGEVPNNFIQFDI